MSAPTEGRDVGNTWQGLPRCKSIFKPSEQETIRCELEAGHEGEHSSSWEWEECDEEANHVSALE